MFAKKILTATVIGMFILSAPMAFAEKRSHDVTAFFFLSKSHIDLGQLIDKIEQSQAGRVLALKMENEDHLQPYYEMRMLKDGIIEEVEVEPESGKVLKTESEGLFSRIFHKKKTIPSTINISLKTAISSVENEYNCKVLAGKLEYDDNMGFFQITAATRDGAFTVMVDTETGVIFRVSRRGDGHHHHEDFDD